MPAMLPNLRSLGDARAVIATTQSVPIPPLTTETTGEKSAEQKSTDKEESDGKGDSLIEMGKKLLEKQKK